MEIKSKEETKQKVGYWLSEDNGETHYCSICGFVHIGFLNSEKDKKCRCCGADMIGSELLN